MSVGMLKELLKLELEILQRRNGMNAEEAWEFHDRLTSFFEDYAKYQYDSWDRYEDHHLLYEYANFQKILDTADYVEKKIIRLHKYLRFYEPGDKSTWTELKVNYDRSGENDQPAATVNLNSLVQKQEFFIQMIDSLVPAGEITSKKAELQFNHVSQIHDRFVSNQSEIMTIVKDAAFDDQVKISTEVQTKVLSLQETLKEMFSPTKPTIFPESNFNRTDCPNVTVDFSDSQPKKQVQKSIIDEIELIESENDPSEAEAETLHYQVTQLYDTFVKNQAKIESHLRGPALDEELEISRQILVKVMCLKTKLKEIFVPVESASLVKYWSVYDSEQMKKPDKDIYLNWLFENQKSLIDEIESMPNDPHLLHFFEQDEVNLLSQCLPKLKTWFVANQMKIEELIDDDFNLSWQKKISAKTLKRVADIQEEYVAYLKHGGIFHH